VKGIFSLQKYIKCKNEAETRDIFEIPYINVPNNHLQKSQRVKKIKGFSAVMFICGAAMMISNAFEYIGQLYIIGLYITVVGVAIWLIRE